MFDNPKKELEKLEKQLLEDEEWFQRELDTAKRMIGQVPAKQQRPSAPRTPQVPQAAPKSAPVRSSGSKQKAQAVPVKEPVEKKKSNKGLVILACAEIVGILGLVAYWVLFLLK
jgi:hypothetical protein